MIDDYTTVHTKGRPDTGKPSAAKSMCTISLKVFKNIQAVSMKEQNPCRLLTPQHLSPHHFQQLHLPHLDKQ